MTGFYIPEFAGMMPRRSKRLLDPRFAQNAVNTELFSGELHAFKDLSAIIVTPSKVGTKRSIYRFGQDIANEAQYWFHWLADVDVARGLISGDASERTYWTGEAEPRVTDNAIALAGGTDYPMAWYKLGVPKPAAAPTLATNGAGAGAAINIAAVYTYVSAWGEEGPPSDASAVLAVKNGDQLTVGNMSVGPGAGYNIATKRIYLGVSGNTAADYQFFAEIPVATTPHAAAFQQANLAEVIKSKTWTPPPAGLKGLVVVAGSYLAGFENNDVWLSERGLPHAWPARYRKSLSFGAVGLGAFDKFLVALTKGQPQGGSSSDPASMQLGKIVEGKACVAKRGIVSLPGGVAYPCADGLGFVSAEGWSMPTDAFFTRREWQQLVPESFSAYRWGNRYVGFYDNGAGTQQGFIFDPSNQNGGFIYIDIYATAGYNDPQRDKLYLQVGNDIKAFDGGAAGRAYTWKSKVFTMPRPINPGYGQVVAVTYPVTFKLYADGALKHTQAVADGKPFRLPLGYKATDFEVQLEGTADVRGVAVAETMQDLKELVT